MSVAEQTRWMEQFMRQTGCTNCFNNILGVLDFFDAEGLGASGTWFSMVDAAILQGISLSYGTFLQSQGIGPAMRNFNPGAAPWAEFFDFRARNPLNEARQRQLWGAAEQAATDYGVWYAEHGINPRTGRAYGLRPTWQEDLLIEITDVYCGAVQVPGAALIPLFDPFHPKQRQMVKDLAVTYWDAVSLLP